MSNTKEWFRTMEAVPADSKVTVGDNRTCLVKGVGSIPFVTTSGKEKVISTILYVLGLCKNLMSVSQMAKYKIVLFEDKKVVVLLQEHR